MTAPAPRPPETPAGDAGSPISTPQAESALAAVRSREAAGWARSARESVRERRQAARAARERLATLRAGSTHRLARSAARPVSPAQD